MNCFFDANYYKSVFSKKAQKKPEVANMWLGTWRDLDGIVRHDILYKAATVNQAEYGSMLMVLRHIFQESESARGWMDHVRIYGDSQLVISQMNGKYKVTNSDLLPLWMEGVNMVYLLSRKGINVTFHWIKRAVNNEVLKLNHRNLDPDAGPEMETQDAEAQSSSES